MKPVSSFVPSSTHFGVPELNLLSPLAHRAVPREWLRAEVSVRTSEVFFAIDLVTIFAGFMSSVIPDFRSCFVLLFCLITDTDTLAIRCLRRLPRSRRGFFQGLPYHTRSPVKSESGTRDECTASYVAPVLRRTAFLSIHFHIMKVRAKEVFLLLDRGRLWDPAATCPGF